MATECCEERLSPLLQFHCIDWFCWLDDTRDVGPVKGRIQHQQFPKFVHGRPGLTWCNLLFFIFWLCIVLLSFMCYLADLATTRIYTHTRCISREIVCLIRNRKWYLHCQIIELTGWMDGLGDYRVTLSFINYLCRRCVFIADLDLDQGIFKRFFLINIL